MYVDIDKEDRVTIYNLTTSQINSLSIAMIKATDDSSLLSCDRLFAKTLVEQLSNLFSNNLDQYTHYEVITEKNE